MSSKVLDKLVTPALAWNTAILALFTPIFPEAGT